MKLINNIEELKYDIVYGIVNDKGEKKLYLMESEDKDCIKFKRVIIIQNNNENKLAMIDGKHKEKIYRKIKLKEMIESGQIEKLIELKVV